jgi:LacI family transcriptional regulator
MKIDGVIGYYTDARELGKHVPKATPVVAIATTNRIEGVPNGLDTGGASGRLAAEHLLAMGLSNYAFCGLANVSWSRVRAGRFAEHVAASGLEPIFHELPRPKAAASWADHQARIAGWLAALPKPAGVMACNDELAQELVEACRSAGIPVPDEVAIIGVDNDENICEHTDPPLSSVAMPHEKIGHDTAALLDRLMSGAEKAGDQVITGDATHVVGRRSTDRSVAADAVVARAIRFISDNAGDRIGTGDVAAAVNVSASGLRRKFRQALGRSILDEIRQTKARRIARMLLETDMTVSQVAQAVGYPGDRNMAGFFKSQMGMTPRDYLKRHKVK